MRDGDDGQGGHAADDAAAAQADAAMSELGYPQGTRDAGERVADSVERGATDRGALRDTDANRRGADELDRIASDPNLTPEQRTQLRQDVAERARAQGEPTGNLEGHVRDARVEQEARARAEQAEPTAQGDRTPGQGERAQSTPEQAPPQGGGDTPRQGSNDLDQLYRDAAAAQQELSSLTRSIADELGGTPRIPPELKGRARAQEKIDADYGGDPSRITDLARSTIEFENPTQLRQAMERLRGSTEIVRVKDRFENPVDGYRDVMMNVRMSNGHIVEVQLHLRAILEVKNGPGHALYEQVRSIDARAQTEGRPLTPDETSRRAQLVEEMTGLYDAAFAGTQRPPQVDAAAPDATPPRPVTEPGADATGPPRPAAEPGADAAGPTPSRPMAGDTTAHARTQGADPAVDTTPSRTPEATPDTTPDTTPTTSSEPASPTGRPANVPESVPTTRQELRAIIAERYRQIIGPQEQVPKTARDEFRPLIEELQRYQPGELGRPENREAAKDLIRRWLAIENQISAETGRSDAHLRAVYEGAEATEFPQWMEQIAHLPRAEQARLAQLHRQELKQYMRELMTDTNSIEVLALRDLAVYGDRRGPQFDALFRKALRDSGGDVDAAYDAIIGSSQRSNADVNANAQRSREAQDNQQRQPETTQDTTSGDDGGAPPDDGSGAGGYGFATAGPGAYGFGAQGSGGGPRGAGTRARGGAEAPARPGPADITHETARSAMTAADSRTTVGVGERVTFTATRAGSWRASDAKAGTSPTGRGRTFRWTAPSTAANVTVTFDSGDGYPQQTIVFQVIRPAGVDFAVPNEVAIPAGVAGAGFHAYVRLFPYTVDFSALQWKEEPSDASARRGYFASGAPNHGTAEGAGRWLSVTQRLGDTARFWGFAQPWVSGSFRWVIPNKYRVRGESGDGEQFTTVIQTCTLSGPPHAGRTTVTKGDPGGSAQPSITRDVTPAAPRAAAPAAARATGWGLGWGHEPTGFGLGLGGEDEVADPRVAELAALRGHIPTAWRPIVELVPATGGTPDRATSRRLQQDSYQRLRDRIAGFEAVQAYLGADPTFAAYQRVLAQVAVDVANDLGPLAQVRAAVARVATDMVERDVHAAALAGYARLSPTGRRCLCDQELVTQLADGPVKQLLRGESALVPLAEPAEEAAAPGAAAADPALDEQFASLKARLLREDPEENTPATRMRRDALVTELRDANGLVLDRLRADTEVSMRIAALTRLSLPGDSGVAYSIDLARAGDSVSQLHRSLLDLEGETAKFNAIKAYLEQRPGPDNQPVRARVMQSQPLMNVITGFTADHQRAIARLIATGSMTRTPMAILQDAAIGQVAASGALNAAIALSRTPGFQELRSDGLFRQTIESGANRTVTTVDGITTSAHDLILRFWGITPTGTGDAESALPQDAINPTQEGPPDAAQLAEINALFPPVINALARELGSVFYVDDAVMVSTLTGFEAACAAPDKRRIFERAHMHPGIELTRRCQADSRIGDLRSKIQRHVDGEQARQVCERVLGIRVDSATVGRIDGSVQLADEAPLSSGTVPLAQALRSTLVAPSHRWATGEMSLSQLVHQAASAMQEKLAAWHLWGGCAGSDITSIYQQLTSTFGTRAVAPPRAEGAPASEPAGARTVRQELERQTGIARIHPIELIVNAFQTVPGGGDLASKINERVEESDRAATLLALHLDAAAVQDRNRAAAPAPAGRFEQRAGELHEALLAGQQAGRNDESQDRADETRLRRAGEVWSQVRALDAAPAAGAAPRPPGAAGAVAPEAETFRATYRRQYGIDPERHVLEVGRAAASLRGTTASQRSQIAQWLRLDPAQLVAAVVAPEAAEALPEATPSGYTRAQAEDAASRIGRGSAMATSCRSGSSSRGVVPTSAR